MQSHFGAISFNNASESEYSAAGQSRSEPLTDRLAFRQSDSPYHLPLPPPPAKLPRLGRKRGWCGRSTGTCTICRSWNTPTGSRSFHDGWLYRCHGLNVLFLRGDAIEMAFQHGRLLADQIPQGAVQGLLKLIDNVVANTLDRRRCGRWARAEARDIRCIPLDERGVTSAHDCLACDRHSDRRGGRRCAGDGSARSMAQS